MDSSEKVNCLITVRKGAAAMDNKNELKALIGVNIKREREKAKLTQDEMSEMIGIETKTLSAIERGTVGISVASLRKICDVLKISPSVILYPHATRNDIRGLADCLERLTPEQFEIANQIMLQLFRAFDADTPTGQDDRK